MKASVPRIKRERNPKGKTLRRSVLSESVDVIRAEEIALRPAGNVFGQAGTVIVHR